MDFLSQLCLSKELAKKEAALKDDVLKQKASIQRLLHLKSEVVESDLGFILLYQITKISFHNFLGTSWSNLTGA